MHKNKNENASGRAEEPARATKIGQLLALMRRPQGADAVAMSQAVGWQTHSVRGAIAGHIKKKLGLRVTAEKMNGRVVYRLGV